MRKAITVHLKCENSHEIRKHLVKNGFQVFIHRCLENKYEPFDEKRFSKTKPHLNENIELVCIYNGKNLSNNQVEKLHKLLEQVYKEPSFIESSEHTTNGS